MNKDAVISLCRQYRYWLSRQWDTSLPMVCFIMLNPSTADDNEDDPTIRKCTGFARRMGYGAIQVVNLFALRSTDPTKLRTAMDPIGPDTDEWICQTAGACRRVICAWGALDVCSLRGPQVSRMLLDRSI